MGRARGICARCEEIKRQDKLITFGNMSFCKHCHSYLRQEMGLHSMDRQLYAMK